MDIYNIFLNGIAYSFPLYIETDEFNRVTQYDFYPRKIK